MKRFYVVLFAAVALALGASVCYSSTVLWVSALGGDWTDASRWSSYPYLPGLSDDVVINRTGVITVTHMGGVHTVRSLNSNQKILLAGGTLNLMENSQCLAGFDHSYGQLGGNGPLVIIGDSQWSGGVISSLGGVTNNGIWDCGGTETRYLRGYITNLGTINHTGTLDISSGGRLHNAAAKTYEIGNDTGITSSVPPGTFDNSGRLTKTAGTGTSSIGCAFNNGSWVEALTGKIQFSGGGTWNGGSIGTNSSSTGVLFSNGTYGIYGSCDWGGGGSVSLAGASLNLATGSEVVCGLGGGLKIHSGTISGLGRIINNQLADWSGGTLSGLGGFENNYTMTLSGTQFKYLENSPFVNWNSITHTGDYGLVFSQSARMRNLGSAVYDLIGDADFISLDGTGQIDNGGTIRKSYSFGTSYVDPYLNSSGIVDVQSGVLELWGGGQFVNGGASVGHQATLGLMDGIFTLYGAYQVGYGGRYGLVGGTFNLTEGATARFGLEQGLFLSGSTVTGHGNLINTLNMDWSSGAITGTTRFSNESGGTLTISSGLVKTLQNAALHNSGSIVQTGLTGLAVEAGGQLNNTSTGAFEFRSDAGISGTGSISNSGVFSKIWDSGTSTVDAVFNNTFGSFDIENGTIRLAGGGSFQGGGGTITHPGVLSFYSGTYAISGEPSFTGMGSATIEGGALSLNTGAQMSFALEQGLILAGGAISGPGAIKNTRNMTWSGGSIAGGAALRNDGVLTISGASQKFLDNAQIHSFGNIVQTSEAGLNMENGALLSCNTGADYEFRTDAGISGAGTINNSGFFRKTFGTGTSVIAPAFNCIGGHLAVSSGSVKLTGGGSLGHSGGANVNATCSLILDGGNYAVNGDVLFGGEGSVLLSSGSLTFSPGGSVHLPLLGGFHLAGGTIAGSGPMLIESTGDWTSGIVAEGADLRIERNKEFTIYGAGGKSLRGGRLLAFGTVHHLGRTAVEVRDRSSIEVAGGIYDLQANGSILGAGEVYNVGFFRKSGSGTSLVEPTLNNIGEVEVMGGGLVFDGPVTQVVEGSLNGGTWIVDEGCTLSLGKEQIHTNAADVTLVGSARFEQFEGMFANAGTLRLLSGRGFAPADAFSNSGTLELAGGEFASGKNLNTGTWDAWGVISGGLNNRGLLKPTRAVDGLRLSGSYTQTTEGTLQVSIGGRAVDRFSRLIVGGSANLNGTLRISLADGFMPLPGDAFEILVCKSRTGKFAGIDGDILGDGLYMNPVYTPTSVVLVAGAYLPPATEVESVAAAKQQTPGAWLSVPGIVSAVFSDSFFIQDANRVAGLRVTGLHTPPRLGCRAQVVGQMTPYTRCVTIHDAQWIVYPDAPKPPAPLLMTNRNLGGAWLGRQGGVFSGVGLNNVGLLVRVTGLVTYLDPGNLAYIDDGCGLIDGNNLGEGGSPVPGVRIILSPDATIGYKGKLVSVTGISYRININDREQRAVLLRSQEDVRYE